MYNRELETDAEKHAAHIRNLKAQSADRLKTVAAKMKLKRKQNKEE